MTLIELMLGIVVLVIAVGATMGAVGSFVKLEESNRETAVAHFAARGMIEQMQDIPFEQIFAAYNEDAGDDPAGIAAGPSFPVDGLDARADDADGMPGQILFPTPAGAPGSLREDLVSDDFDLPKDLNVDGAIDANDHADDYQLLPVRIRIEWRGASGNRSLEMQTLLRR